MLLGLIYLIAICTLLVWAVRIIRQRELQEQLAEAQYEARYHRQEAEITLSVSQRILSGFAARVSAVYGQDYQDYLIARQMRLNGEQPPERERPRLIIGRRETQGYNITGDSAAEWQAHRERMAEYERQQRPACWRTPEPPQGYTPPQQWQARAQVPCVGFRQPAGYAPRDDWQDEWEDGDDWPYDDDVLDVQALPVYPPALLPQLPQPPHAPIGGGRQRKYASDADRQRAYRERRKQRR